MIGVRGRDERSGLHRQQVVFTHHAQNSLAVDQHSQTSQLDGHSAIAITPPVLQHDLLNRRPHLGLLLFRSSLLQPSVKPSATDPRQLAHTLDTQATLHRHHFPDLVIDAVSPEPLLPWRRASIFCKAPLKKSTSRVLSASTRFRSRTCLRSSRIGESAAPPSMAFRWFFQWYSTVR